MTVNTKILQLAAQAHRDVDAYATADLLHDAAGEIDAQAAQLEAYPADWRSDSSLETWFPLTAEQLKAQTAEIARLKAAPVWQLIETAPKDRRILLMRDGNRICIGRYCPDRGALNVLPEYWTDEGYGVTWARNHPPTHWMPLPDAPVALQGTSNDR